MNRCKEVDQVSLVWVVVLQKGLNLWPSSSVVECSRTLEWAWSNVKIIHELNIVNTDWVNSIEGILCYTKEDGK